MRAIFCDTHFDVRKKDEFQLILMRIRYTRTLLQVRVRVRVNVCVVFDTSVLSLFYGSESVGCQSM